MADVIKSVNMNSYYVLSSRIQIEFTIGAGNKSTNSTPISYKIYIINNDPGYDGQRWLTSNSPQASLTFGGSNIRVTPNSFTIVGTGATNNTDFATIASGTFNYKHNSNGVAGTVNFSTTVDPKIPTILNHGPVTITGTVTIPNIAVHTKSTMSIPSQLTIGKSVTASVSSSSSSYYHTVYISVGGKTANLGTRTGGGNITNNVPSSLATGLGNKVSAQGTAYIYTYTSSGGSLIGSMSYSVTVHAGATVKPTMTGSNATVVDADAKAKAITGGNNKDYIATISDINVTIPNSAINLLSGTSTTSRRATIYKKGTSTKIEEKTTTGTTVVINNIPNPSSATEEWDVKVSIQDSRGVWSDEYLAETIKVYRYIAPTANATVNRHGTTPTTIVTSISFKYSPLTIGGSVKNTLNLTLKGGYVGDTADKLTSKEYTSTSGTWAPTITGVASTRSYVVGLIMDDGITSTTIEIGRVGTEEVPLDIYKNGIGVGKIHSEGSANLEVGTGGISSEGPFVLDSHMVLSKHINGRVDIRGYADDSPLIVRGIDGTGGNTGEPDGDLYLNNISKGQVYIAGTNKAWHQGNDGSGSGLDADLLDGKHASTIISEAISGVKSGGATTGAVSGRGRWFKTGNLLICTQVAFINTYFSQYSITGSWTYPVAFSEAPFVQVAGGHDGMADNTYRMNGELSAYDVTATGTSVHFAGGPFASGNSKRVYMLAIGRV